MKTFVMLKDAARRAAPQHVKPLIIALCTTSMLGISTQASASAFQLWEQDGASIGNYHAGYAAAAEDASTAWYNPAGITRFRNQQIVLGAAAIAPDFLYKGSVTVSNTFPPPLPPMDTVFFPGVTAQGGTFAIVPNIHYVTPINDRIGFGFSVDSPFGLKTNYGFTTPLRYAATMTSIAVIDASPSLGVRVTDKASLGAGFDVQRATAEFDSVAVATSTPNSDTRSTNKADSTGYGYHLGVLYEFTPDTRVGISYHSKVHHDFSGTSKFAGPIADAVNNGVIRSSAHTNVTLPAYTALSAYSHILPQLAIMGSVIYTQWGIFDDLTLRGISGVVNAPLPIIIAPSTNITVVVPEHYRNTWNLSAGADYFITDRVTLRGAIGYDETPVRDAFRNVQLPDASRYIVALGAHFTATRALGVDIGWTHLFFPGSVPVHPPATVMGAQVTETNGRVTGGADVYGAQLTWDIV